MPNNVQIDQAIRAAFLAPVTGWAALQPGVPIMFSGGAFDPPDQGNYIRVTIMGANTQQVEFGIRQRIRRFGIVRVQFWLVAGEGSGTAWAFADSVADIIEARTIADVRFHGTSPPIDERAEGSWYRWRVDTDFDADELVTV